MRAQALVICSVAMIAVLTSLQCLLAQALPSPVVSIPFDGPDSSLEVSGKLELVEGGVRGTALKAGQPGNAIAWKMNNSALSWEQGTISFWFKPIDWSGTARFRHWLYTVTPGTDRTLNLVVAGIESSPAEEHLTFRLKDLMDRPAHQWNGFTGWKNGQWYFITATWNKERASLFLNGEMDAEGGGTHDITTGPFIDAETFKGTILYIATDANWKKYDTVETSLMDELEIRDQSLSPEQVRELYYAQKPKESSAPAPAANEKAAAATTQLPNAPRLIVPADAAVPTIEGAVNDDEWADAAAFSGLNDGDKGVLIDKPFVGYVKSDGKKLYLAFRSKVPGVEILQHDNNSRDAQTYLDDSWEVYIYPDQASADYYQIVVNSEGAIFDWYAKDISWNGPWELKQRVERPDVWDAEMAIPLEALGLKGDIDGAQWRLGFFVNQKGSESRSFAWTPQMGMFEQPDRAALLTFRKGTGVVSLPSLGKPTAGLISPVVTWTGSERTAAVTVTDSSGEQTRKMIDSPGQAVPFPPLQGKGRALVTVLSPADAKPDTADFHYSTIIAYDSVPVTVRATNYPSREEVTIELNYGSLTGAESIKNYVIDLGDGPQTIARTAAIPWEKVPLKTSTLKPGARECTVSLVDEAGQSLASKKFRYIKEGGEEWRNNTVGIVKGYVPPPYTPMQVNGNTVEVIGRKIELAETGLPQQIVSAGVSLLAGPVQFAGEFDGQQTALHATGDFSYTEVGADDSVGTAQIEIGPLAGTLRQMVSFDGLLWYEIDLSSKTKTNAKNVAIEIPLPADVARYYQLTDTDYKLAGLAEWEISDVLKKDLSLPFTPQVYLGNDKAGLSWMVETHKGWQVLDDKKVIEIIRKEGNVILRINVVDEAIDLSEIKLAFGIQPTPVKPVTDWQQRFIFTYGRYREFPADALVYNVYQGHRSEDPATFEAYCGFPEPANPELALQAAELQKSQGANLSPYAVFTWLSLGMPEMQTYGGDWYLNQPWAAVAGLSANPEPYGLVDTENRDFQDFIVWRFMKNWNAYGGSSMYYDLYSPHQDKLPEHNRAYLTRSGRTAYPWPIWSIRNIVRRLYIGYKQNNPEFACFTHASNLYTALVSFGDAWPVGEHYSFAAGRYPEVLTYDRYRAWFYGYPLGVKTMFLPSLKTSALVKHKELTNYLTGIVFNHNTTFWVCFINQPILLPFLRTYHAGNWPLQQFYPYWDYPKLTNLDPEKFKVSGWYNPDTKKGLLVIASLSPTDVTTKIVTGPDWTFSKHPKLSDGVRKTIGITEFGGWTAPARYEGQTGTFQPYGVLMLEVE